MTQSEKETAVHIAATLLLKANNTVTTLEIKDALRLAIPESWYQTSDNPKGEPGVSEMMDKLCKAGNFDFVDAGTYRVYSGAPVVTNNLMMNNPVTGNTVTTAPTVSTVAPVEKVKTRTASGLKFNGPIKYISRTSAKKMMANNKGHFFTAVFIAKKGERTMNCQWLKDQTGADLGYVKVKEAALIREAKAIEQANLIAGGPVTKVPSVIRNVNLQTLKAIKIGGQLYKVR